MRRNNEQKWKDMTLKSVEARLRCLPEVEVPKTLKARLLDAIVGREAKVTGEHRGRWHPWAWDFGTTAAAAVLIFALVFMVNYGLSIPSQGLLTEFDTSLCCPRWDQNNFLYDQNNACAEEAVLYQFQWPIIHQNESTY